MLRLASITAILWCQWEQLDFQQPAPVRPTEAPEHIHPETSTPPSPLSIAPANSPTGDLHTPIPEPLIANVIIASSLNHIYTTDPASPAVKTENTEAEDITTLIENGKELVPIMVSRVGTLLSWMEPLIPEDVFGKVVTRLVWCDTCWHNPALETRQPHGLDALQQDRIGRRTLLAIQSQTVNPWLFHMVGDYHKINKLLQFMHHKLNEIQLDIASLAPQH